MAPALSNTDADYDVVVIGSGVGGYPDYFASLTDGRLDLFSETWTYGRRQQARTPGAEAEMSTGRPARDFGVPKVILSPLRIEDFDLH